MQESARNLINKDLQQEQILSMDSPQRPKKHHNKLHFLIPQIPDLRFPTKAQYQCDKVRAEDQQNFVAVTSNFPDKNQRQFGQQKVKKIGR